MSHLKAARISRVLATVSLLPPSLTTPGSPLNFLLHFPLNVSHPPSPNIRCVSTSRGFMERVSCSQFSGTVSPPLALRSCCYTPAVHSRSLTTVHHCAGGGNTHNLPVLSADIGWVLLTRCYSSSVFIPVSWCVLLFSRTRSGWAVGRRFPRGLHSGQQGQARPSVRLPAPSRELGPGPGRPGEGQG